MSAIINPYIAGNPVTHPYMFFGREDVFQSIRNTLIGEYRDNSIIIYGQQRTGKTSILYQLRSHLGQNYFCILVDLQMFALKDLDSFLWDLAKSITYALKKEYQIHLSVIDYNTFMSNPRIAFTKEFLDSVHTAIGGRYILLMFDEVIRLQEIQTNEVERGIFEYMSHLMQHYTWLNFLFSLSNSVELMDEETKRKYTFLLKIGLYKKISFLTQSETNELITQPVKNHYHITSDAQEEIFSITSGHPYHTQLLCQCLFMRWQKQNASLIDVQDVKDVLGDVVEQGSFVLTRVWTESLWEEKAIMAGMVTVMGEHNYPVEADTIMQVWVNRGITIPKGAKNNAIRRLIERDIIISSDDDTDSYKFTVDLQRIWIQKQKRLEWVENEIVPLMPTIEFKNTQRATPEPKQPDVLMPPTMASGEPEERSNALLKQEEISNIEPEDDSTAITDKLKPLPKLTIHLENTQEADQTTKELTPSNSIAASRPDVSEVLTVVPLSSQTFSHPSRFFRRRKILISAIGLGVVGLAVVGGITLEKFASETYQTSLPLGTTLFSYKRHTDSIYGTAWSPDDGRIASSSKDKTVQIWNVDSGQTLITYKNHSDTVFAVKWSPDGKRIASASNDKTVQIWNPSSAKNEVTYINHHSFVDTLAWSPNGDYIASGGGDKKVKIWQTNSGQDVFDSSHNGYVLAIIWSPNGTYIASGGADGTIEIVDFTMKKTMLAYQGHPAFVAAIGWSPDNKYIVTGGGDSLVKIWDASSGQLVRSLKGHQAPVFAVAWSFNGKYIASGGQDKTVKVWNASSGQEIFTYRGHTDEVYDVEWSHTSNRVVSGGRDKIVNIWKGSR